MNVLDVAMKGWTRFTCRVDRGIVAVGGPGRAADPRFDGAVD